MSETKFTKGPWRISKGSNFSNIIDGPNGGEVNDWNDGYSTVATVQSCTDSYRHDDKEANQLANMHLVAAAPELYKALDELLVVAASDHAVMVSPHPLRGALIKQACAALSKARGET